MFTNQVLEAIIIVQALSSFVKQLANMFKQAIITSTLLIAKDFVKHIEVAIIRTKVS